jgi:hypothetical protein
MSAALVRFTGSITASAPLPYPTSTVVEHIMLVRRVAHTNTLSSWRYLHAPVPPSDLQQASWRRHSPRSA